MSTKRIATSPLTGRIFSGRVNKEGTAFTGEKIDVTSDVLRAVIEKCQYHGGTFEIVGTEGAKFVLTLTKGSS